MSRCHDVCISFLGLCYLVLKMLENYNSLIDVHIYFKWLCCVTVVWWEIKISLLVMWDTSNLHETWRLRKLCVNKSNSSCNMSGRNRFKKWSIFIVYFRWFAVSQWFSYQLYEQIMLQTIQWLRILVVDQESKMF